MRLLHWSGILTVTLTLTSTLTATLLQRTTRAVAIVCLGCLIACGGKSKRGDLWWADKHDKTPATSPELTVEHKIPRLNRAEAKLHGRVPRKFWGYRFWEIGL